jgi:hypothetical protein
VKENGASGVVKTRIGGALCDVQIGLMAPAAKAPEGFGDAGVLEVVVDFVAHEEKISPVPVRRNACCQKGSLPRPYRLLRRVAIEYAKAYGSRSLCRGL